MTVFCSICRALEGQRRASASRADPTRDVGAWLWGGGVVWLPQQLVPWHLAARGLAHLRSRRPPSSRREAVSRMLRSHPGVFQSNRTVHSVRMSRKCYYGATKQSAGSCAATQVCLSQSNRTVCSVRISRKCHCAAMQYPRCTDQRIFTEAHRSVSTTTTTYPSVCTISVHQRALA